VTHRFVTKRDSCNYTLQGESFVSKPECVDAYNREFVRLMGEAGWTATDCVNRLGLSKGAISQYRNGITRPSLQVLRLFASLSGVQLKLPGEAPPPDPLTSVSDQERRILLTLRRIPSDQRIAIANMLTAVAGPEPVDGHSEDETEKVASAATAVLAAAVVVQTSQSEPVSVGDASKPTAQLRSDSGKSDRKGRRIRSV
jgi:transcriptional regulator with XRE-family HTH domain